MGKAVFSEAEQSGARHLLFHCGNFSEGERLVVVCDDSTKDVGACVIEEAGAYNRQTVLLTAPLAAMHGEEPPDEIAEAMETADLVLCLREKSMAHTKARLAMTERGGRYLSLPDFSRELLVDPSLLVNYREQYACVRRITDAFTKGSRVRVTTQAGTDVTLEIDGRIGNCCPGFVEEPGSLGSPPDIESNVSPLEYNSQGVVVVDGSIPFPGYGLLDSPVRLEIHNGSIVNIDAKGTMASSLSALFDTQDPEKSRILAECGVGLNPAAKLTGVMLTDEGALGTMHFGFGSNNTVGGKNDIPFHIDFVFRNPTLTIDDHVYMSEGQLTE